MLDIVLATLGILFLINIFYFASKQVLSPTLLFIGLAVSCVLITLSIVHFVKTGHPIIHGRKREFSFDRVTHRDHVPHKNIVLIILLIVSVIVLFNLNTLDTITGFATVEHTSLGEFGMGWTGRTVFASDSAVQIDLSEYLFHISDLDLTFTVESTEALQTQLNDSLLSVEFTPTSERKNIVWIVAEDSLGNKRRFAITVVYLLKRDIAKENAIALLRAESPILGDAYEFVPIVEEPIIIPKPPVVDDDDEDDDEDEDEDEDEEEQLYFDGINIKDKFSRKVGKLIEDDPDYETMFHIVELTDENLTIVFSHNANTSLSIWVEALDDDKYILSTDNAEPGENVTLVVELEKDKKNKEDKKDKKGKIPKFNLHIGEDSDVFGFGDSGFQDQAALVCGDATIEAAQTFTVSILTACTGVGGAALTVSHEGTILEIGAELSGDSGYDVITVASGGELTINYLGVGSIVHVGSGGDAIDALNAKDLIINGGGLDITGNIRGKSSGGITITDVNVNSGDIIILGNNNRITSVTVDADHELKLTNADDVIVNRFTGGSINVDPSFNITIANTTLGNTDNCLIIDNSNTTLVYNVTFENCSANAINITNGSRDNVIRNCTFLNNTVGVGIYNGTNNSIYWNNFTNLTDPFNNFVLDSNAATSNNSLNTSVGGVPQGNQYADIGDFSIFDSDSDNFGDTGNDYPYGRHSDGTTIGNITGNITDYGPWYPTAPALNACANLTQDAILTSNIIAPTLDTCILVNASGISLDCRGYSIVGNSSGIGIAALAQTGIIIKNCHVDNFTRGIELNDTNHSFVQNNTASNNSYSGIQLNNCVNGTVTWNTFTNNSVLGIYMVSTNNSNFTQNLADLNLNNPFRFDLSSNNIVTHNIVRDNPGGSASAFYISNTNYLTLYNNTMYNNGQYGIYLLSSNYNNVTNNTAYNNTGGIYLTGSNNNLFYNTAYNNTEHGFQTSTNNGLNLFINNSAFNNSQMGYLISGSHNNTWINNTAYNNTRIGFSITNSRGNNFTRCTANDNNWDGFRFLTSVSPGAENHTLTGCSAQGNDYADLNVTGQVGFPSCGIYLNDSVFSTYGFDQAGIIIENSSAGILRYLNNSITESGDNLSLDIQIKNNSVYVNSSGQPGLNTTANITLFDISGFSGHPNIFADRDDDGIFEEECVEPDCYNLSYSGNTFIFNTTRFTEFKTADIMCGMTITQDTTLTKNLTGTITCITIGAHNVVFDCAGYTITGNYSTGTYGVSSTGKANITVKNCDIFNFSNGIFIQGSNNATLLNNTLRNNSAYGISLSSQTNSRILNNTLYNNSDGNIITTSSSHGAQIINNNVTDSSGGWGIYVGTSQNSSLRDNVANGNSITYYFVDVDNVSSTNDVVLGSTSFGFSVRGNVTITNGTSTAAPTDLNVDQFYQSIIKIINSTIADYNIQNATNFELENENGSVMFTSDFAETGTNLFGASSSDIRIRNNSVFVNSSGQPGLNISANLTFYSISLTDPEPYYDPEDDGSFVHCPASICTEQSYTGTTYKYNVSHFTAFKAQEIPACNQTITSNTMLTQNLTSTGDCFTLNASGITLDCAGYTITGDDTGGGIKIINASNVTIINCFIKKFTCGIDISNTTNSSIYNNTLEENQKGIYLNFSSSNNLINNTLSQNQDGIYLRQSSFNVISNNYAYNNTIAGINVNSHQSLWYANCSDYNNITNNTVSFNKEGIYLHCEYHQQPTGNIISNNIFFGNIFSSVKEYTTKNTISSNSYINNLNNVFFSTNLTHSLQVGIIKEFNISVHYANGTDCNSFTINNITTSPEETTRYTKIGNRIYGNFTPNREGLYSLKINISGCNQNEITQRYYFGNQIQQRFYLINGSRNDEGYLVLNAPSNYNYVWCTMWVQAYIKNATNDTGILKITDINTSLVYNATNTTSGNNLLGVQNIVTFSRERDASQIIPESVGVFNRIERHFDTGWFIYNSSDWQDVGVKMESGTPQWLSQPGNLSYIDVNYLYTVNPTLKYISNKNIQIVSATSPQNQNNSAKIILDGTGNTILSILMPNATYNVSYDGQPCSGSNCTFTQYNGEINISLTLGSIHTLDISAFFACGQTLTSDTTLTGNLQSNGTCFTIGAENIILDCVGYEIKGNGTGSGYGVLANLRNNVTIKNCKIQNFSHGIFLNYSNSSFIYNNTLHNNSEFYLYYGSPRGSGDGLHLNSSHNNNITLNTAYNNSDSGIELRESSNNTLASNRAYQNIREGFELVSSRNNTLSNNTANNNTREGFYFISSSNNLLTSNTANNSIVQGGFYFSNSQNNTFTSNTANNNNREGFYFSNSANNTLTSNTANNNIRETF
ncbi:MAG: right-handed parallel beta-helix repeat-containing protein, partial [Nanoarchaeota archaeon]|nr:right-handed parallel beta-helix repeat-containing protein [Nanoarchaeota archaeon]